MDETSELLEIAEILLELPQLFRRFSFTWGTKKRRSSIPDTPTLSSTGLSPSPSPPSVPETVVATATATCETEKEKPKALSPATPLLFSPSESDEKSKHSKRRKVSLKRKTEECLRMIQELTERKEFFKEEIKNVQRYYDQQKLLNLRLKERKQMIILGLQGEEESRSQWNSNSSCAIDLAQPRIQVDGQDEQSAYMMQQQPFIVADTARTIESSQCQYGQKFSSSSHGSGLCRDFIPDLNLSLEEPLRIEPDFGLGQLPSLAVSGKSERKALAAQARLRRIQICRSKNPYAAIKLRYPSHL